MTDRDVDGLFMFEAEKQVYDDRALRSARLYHLGFWVLAGLSLGGFAAAIIMVAFASAMVFAIAFAYNLSRVGSTWDEMRGYE